MAREKGAGRTVREARDKNSGKQREYIKSGSNENKNGEKASEIEKRHKNLYLASIV